MKKTTLILIGIVYALSIVLVSLLGMKAIDYKPMILVTSIEVINTTNEKWTVFNDNEAENTKRIELVFNGEDMYEYLDENDNPVKVYGNYLQLFVKILPENATKKAFTFHNNSTSRNIEFVNDSGLIFFKGKAFFTVTINSIDGSGISTTVTIHCK